MLTTAGCVAITRSTIGAGTVRDPLALPAATRPEIRVQDLDAHIRALSDPRTEGRLAGSPGERLAADYLARAFRALGLEPAGDDGSFEHSFSFTSGIALGPDNALSILRAGGSPAPRTEPPRVDRDWRPLAFSRSGRVPPSAVVFAGYGLVAPAEGERAAIDDYAGLDVQDRWVMVFRDLPRSLDPEVRQALQPHASLRYKAMIARDRGARGLLIVNGPDGRYREPLIPLRFDAALAGTRIAVLSIANALAARLLEPSGPSLEALQTAVDRALAGDPDPGFTRPGVLPDLEIGARIDLETQRAEGRNVVARLPLGPHPSAETIVLGAHFDHLGHGEGSSSLASGDELGRIHPGADDNASGTALLLEIAEALAARQRARSGGDAHDARSSDLGQRDFVFAAWSGEELGLLGSNAWTEEQLGPHASSSRPVAYLNFDMVGRLRESLVVQGFGSSRDWTPIVERALEQAGLSAEPDRGRARGRALTIVRQDDSYVPSDSTSFYTHGVPVLNAFTGVHAEYHTPRDTPDLLDLPGMVPIGELFAAIAIELSRAESPPAYQAQSAPVAGTGRSGFRVFLGTVPDYAQTDVRGVRLSGVAPAGPAEQAGLRGGDVIVEVDGRVIENLYDYTFALEALQVGVGARIGVLREGERIDLEVFPASRD